MPFNTFGACCVLLYTRSSSIIQAQFTVTCDYVCPNDINGTLRSMRMYIYSMGHPLSQTIKLPKHPSKGSCLLLVLGQSVETVPSLMPCLLCFYGALLPVLSLSYSAMLLHSVITKRRLVHLVPTKPQQNTTQCELWVSSLRHTLIGQILASCSSPKLV